MALEFLSPSEKELHSKLLPEVKIEGKTMTFQGQKLDFSAEPKDPEKVKELILALFIRGLTVKNLRDLKGEMFQPSKLNEIGFGGVTVDDGVLSNTTLLSNDAIINLFKLNPYHGTKNLENQADTISKQIISFLNSAVIDYTSKNKK